MRVGETVNHTKTWCSHSHVLAVGIGSRWQPEERSAQDQSPLLLSGVTSSGALASRGVHPDSQSFRRLTCLDAAMTGCAWTPSVSLNFTVLRAASDRRPTIAECRDTRR